MGDEKGIWFFSSFSSSFEKFTFGTQPNLKQLQKNWLTKNVENVVVVLLVAVVIVVVVVVVY